MSRHLSRHLIATYLQEQLDHTVRLVRLTQLSSNLPKYNKKKLIGSSLPRSIISIDIGIKNLAYVHITSHLKILDWKKIALDLKSFEPKDIIDQLIPLVNQSFLPKPNSHNNNENDNYRNDNEGQVDLFIIERQNFRAFSSAIITNVMMIESMLFALLTTLSDHRHHHHQRYRFEVQSSFSTGVNQYLNRMIRREVKSVDSDYPEDEIARWLRDLGKNPKVKEYLGQGAHGRRGRKNFSKLLAQYWINDHANLCSKEITDYFNNAKKKDDLADCLLQGLVYLGCRRFSIHEANKWIIE